MSKTTDERAVQLFKQGWEAAKFPKVLEAGGVKMPRERYAKATAFAIHSRLAEMPAETPAYAAALEVISSPVGNPSGLMQLLIKDEFLKEASATETADALLEMLRLPTKP